MNIFNRLIITIFLESMLFHLMEQQSKEEEDTLF
jgi:hypothetical protein